MRKVRYRLDVDYLSKDYSDRALETSCPIYTKKDGMKQYAEAIKHFCVDNDKIHCRCRLWKYGGWDDSNRAIQITIAKNY